MLFLFCGLEVDHYIDISFYKDITNKRGLKSSSIEIFQEVTKIEQIMNGIKGDNQIYCNRLLNGHFGFSVNVMGRDRIDVEKSVMLINEKMKECRFIDRDKFDQIMTMYNNKGIRVFRLHKNRIDTPYIVEGCYIDGVKDSYNKFKLNGNISIFYNLNT